MYDSIINNPLSNDTAKIIDLRASRNCSIDLVLMVGLASLRYLSDYFIFASVHYKNSCTSYDFDSCSYYIFNFLRFIQSRFRVNKLNRKVLDNTKQSKADILRLFFYFSYFPPHSCTYNVSRSTQYAFFPVARDKELYK